MILGEYMKIAMIGHKRIPSREGGVEIVVEELTKGLSCLGHNVDVYNRMGNNVQDKHADSKDSIVDKNIKIFTVPTVNKKGIDAFFYSVIASIIISFKKYDIVHYHAEGSCAMLWLPHFFKKKIVVTIHGLDWQRSKWGGFATKYIKFGEKMAVKYADEIIVLSKNIQKYFEDEYSRKTLFIPNGVNIPTIRQPNIIFQKYGLNTNEYILFLSRIVPEKGLHYLIDAYESIKTDKKLVIAGGSSHTNEYLNIIRDKVKDNKNIIMTGFVQGELLEELFSNCFLYCLPSEIEGMPISLLEAMSYGCSCLVSDIPEIRQIAKKTAIYFEKSNSGSLKEKLQILLSNKVKCDKKQVKLEASKYKWTKVVKKTESLYQKVIK